MEAYALDCFRRQSPFTDQESLVPCVGSHVLSQLSTIDYQHQVLIFGALTFDLRLSVFDAHLSATQALSLCLYQSSGRRQPERMLRAEGLRRSV
jgi:hypothetical protein